MKNRLLVITNMYPSTSKPYFGIFVKEQVEELSECINLSVLSKETKGNRIFTELFFVFNVCRKVLQSRGDVIHVHFGLTAIYLLPIIIYLKLNKTKLILTLHGSDLLGSNWFVPRWTKFILNHFDLIIAVSKQIELKAIEVVGKDKVVWLPCGIDNKFFTNTNDDIILSKIRKRIIVFPSTPSREEKDYDRFKKIIDLVEKETDIRFEVLCLTGLSRESVIDTLKNATCLLMTSKYEGSPQTVKEAIALGTPVVSTAVGDVPFILKSFENCLCSNLDQDLALQVVSLLKSGARVRKSSTFEEQYKQSSIVSKLIAIYKSKCL